MRQFVTLWRRRFVLCEGCVRACRTQRRTSHSVGAAPHTPIPTESATAPPSAREIHGVVQRALEQGRREHAVDLFVGALQLHCVPLAETYELLLSNTVRHRGWRAVVHLMDELGGDAASLRSLYHTVADMYLLFMQHAHGRGDDGDEAGEQPLLGDMMSLIEAAAVRHVQLAARHRLPVWEGLVAEERQASRMIQFYKEHVAPGGMVMSAQELVWMLRAASSEGDWACAMVLYRQWLAASPSTAPPDAQVPYIESFIRALEKSMAEASKEPTAHANPPLIPWQEAVELLVHHPEYGVHCHDGRRGKAALEAPVAAALARLENTAEALHLSATGGRRCLHVHGGGENAPVSRQPVAFSAADVVAAWLPRCGHSRTGPALNGDEVKKRLGTATHAAAVLRVLCDGYGTAGLGSPKAAPPVQAAHGEREIQLMCLVLSAFPALCTLPSREGLPADNELPFRAWMPQPWRGSLWGSPDAATETPLWRTLLAAWHRDAADHAAPRDAMALYLTYHAWWLSTTPAQATAAATAHTRCLDDCARLSAHPACSSATRVALLLAAAHTVVSLDEVTTSLTALVETLAQQDVASGPAVLHGLLRAAAVPDNRRWPPSTSAQVQHEGVSCALRKLAVCHVLRCAATPVGEGHEARVQEMKRSLEAALLASGDVEAAAAYAIPAPGVASLTRVRDVLLPLLAQSQQWARIVSLLGAGGDSSVGDLARALEGDTKILSILRQARLAVTGDGLREAVRAGGHDPDGSRLQVFWQRYHAAYAEARAAEKGAAPEHAIPSVERLQRLSQATLIRVGVRLAVGDYATDLQNLLRVVDDAPPAGSSAHEVVRAEALRLYMHLRGSTTGEEAGPAPDWRVAFSSACVACEQRCPRLVPPHATLALSLVAALALARRQQERIITSAGGRHESSDAVIAVLASAAQRAVLWTQRYRHQPLHTEVSPSPMMSADTVDALADLEDVMEALLPSLRSATLREWAQANRRASPQLDALVLFYLPMALASPRALTHWAGHLEALQTDGSAKEGARRSASRQAWCLFTLLMTELAGDGVGGQSAMRWRWGAVREALPSHAMLVVLEVCVRDAALTRTQWQQVCACLVTQRPAAVGAAAVPLQVRYDALVDAAMSGLAALGAWQDALACLPLRTSPLPTAPGSTPRTFTAADALVCLQHLTAESRQGEAERAELRHSLFALVGLAGERPPRAGAGAGDEAVTPRQMLARWLALGAWEEALEFCQFVLALRERADTSFIQTEALALTRASSHPRWSLSQVEDCLDVDTVVRIMRLVCTHAPWRTSWRAWLHVRASLPYVDWTATTPACDTLVEVLLCAMRAQGAPPHALLDGLLVASSQWGVTVRAPWLRVVACALQDQAATGTAAENALCLERLEALRRISTERHVTALVETIVVEYFGAEPEALRQPPFPPHQPASSEDESGASDAVLDTLALLAPLVLLATPRQLDSLAKTHFAHENLHATALRPLLRREAYRVRARLASRALPDSTEEWLVAQLARQHGFVVRFAGLLTEAPLRAVAGASCAVLAEEVRRIVFDGFIAGHTAHELVRRTLHQAHALARCRWSPIVEAELRTAMQTQQLGKPPTSLRTAPQLSRTDIAHYWGVFHDVLMPELHLDGTELCCLAAYTPYVEALRTQSGATAEVRQAALRELAAAVHAVHMTPAPGSVNSLVCSPTTPWHRPAYVVAILYAHSHKLLRRLLREVRAVEAGPSGLSRVSEDSSVVSPSPPTAHQGEVVPHRVTAPRMFLGQLLGAPAEGHDRLAADMRERLLRRLSTLSTSPALATPFSNHSLTAAAWTLARPAQEVSLYALLALIRSWVCAGEAVPEAASLELVEVVKHAMRDDRSTVARPQLAAVDPPPGSLVACLSKSQCDRLRDSHSEARLEAAARTQHLLWHVWQALDEVPAWSRIQPLHVAALRRALAPTEAMIAGLPLKVTRRREHTDSRSV